MNRRSFFAAALLTGAFVFAVAVMLLLRGNAWHPHIVIEGPGQVEIRTLFHSRPSRSSCNTLLADVASVMAAACPGCRVLTRECIDILSPDQQLQLGDRPLPVPSARMPNGIVTFHAPDKALALDACRQSARLGTAQRVACYAPDTPRSHTPSSPRWLDWTNLAFAALLMLAAQIATHLACYAMVRFEHMHARFSHDHPDERPQRFHAEPTPRIGGIALWIGLMAGSVVLLAVPQSFVDQEFGLLVLAALPVFIGGLADDLTKNFGVRERFALSIASALLAWALLDVTLRHAGTPGLDALLRWEPFAVVFTVVAISGVTNALNIVDGYNGIAAGLGLIASIALAIVSAFVSDPFLVSASLTMTGGLLGFFVWNWPRARIFLGDGGAYLLGFWLAVLSILLVMRHPEISPWFPMLLLIHPVFEALYSIYRRKVRHKVHPAHPDAHHLHQFIYLRLVERSGAADEQASLRHNRRVAPRLWLLSIPLAAIAVLFPGNTTILATATMGYCLVYLYLYRRLAPR